MLGLIFFSLPYLFSEAGRKKLGQKIGEGGGGGCGWREGEGGGLDGLCPFKVPVKFSIFPFNECGMLAL